MLYNIYLIKLLEILKHIAHNAWQRSPKVAGEIARTKRQAQRIEAEAEGDAVPEEHTGAGEHVRQGEADQEVRDGRHELDGGGAGEGSVQRGG